MRSILWHANFGSEGSGRGIIPSHWLFLPIYLKKLYNMYILSHAYVAESIQSFEDFRGLPRFARQKCHLKSVTHFLLPLYRLHPPAIMKPLVPTIMAMMEPMTSLTVVTHHNAYNSYLHNQYLRSRSWMAQQKQICLISR